jgi:hypothetical protein
MLESRYPVQTHFILEETDSRINLSLMIRSGDDSLYKSEYTPDAASTEDTTRQQRLIDLAKERKNKKAQQPQSKLYKHK